MKVSLESFVFTDPYQLNHSPYLAFNGTPNSYVDENGKVPISTVEILTPKFGTDHLEQYENLESPIV